MEQLEANAEANDGGHTTVRDGGGEEHPHIVLSITHLTLILTHLHLRKNKKGMSEENLFETGN